MMGTAILVAATIGVGLTAPADGPFTIEVRPVFLRLDAGETAASRPTALGLDVDVTLGSLHLHFGWSAIPLAALAPATTKSPVTLL
jgi:hypothetical protein